MKRLMKKPFSWAILFSLILLGTSTYVLLDTFVLPKTYTKAVSNNTSVLASNSKDAASLSSNEDTSGTDNKQINATVTPNAAVTNTSESVKPIKGKKKSNLKIKKKDSSNKKKSVAKKNTPSISKTPKANASIANNISKKKEIGKASNKTTKIKTFADSSSSNKEAENSPSKETNKENQYKDSNIEIKIDTIREYNTSVHIADIKISNISYFKAAFANDTYGRNIKAATSAIAENHKAIFAVNGDFYGFRDYGYVLRNGTLYRDTAGNSEDLIINNKGDFTSIDESKTSANSLDLKSIWQIFSFGPVLVNGGEIKVDASSEVTQSMASNPRTAVGMLAPLHYLFVVSDGRTSDNKGLSLLELAKILKNKGCTTAYNLDGGGSATMYFKGKVINNPTDGFYHGERKVSDIIYIGD